MKTISHAVMKALRLRLLKAAIRMVERAGLAVVQVKPGRDRVYLVGANGAYVRFDKVKEAKA